MHVQGFPTEVKARWLDQCVHSSEVPAVYRIATAYLLHEFANDWQKALIALDWSLLGPIDLMCSEDEMLLEDVHPVLRLQTVIPILKGLKLSSAGTIYGELDARVGSRSSISRSLRLATTRKLMDERSYTVHGINDLPEKDWEPIYYLTLVHNTWSHLFWHDVEDQFRGGLVMRSERSGILELLSPRGITLYRPVVEIYRDRMIDHNPSYRQPIIFQGYEKTMEGLSAGWLMGREGREGYDELKWVADSISGRVSKPLDAVNGALFENLLPLERDQFLSRKFRVATDTDRAKTS